MSSSLVIHRETVVPNTDVTPNTSTAPSKTSVPRVFLDAFQSSVGDPQKATDAVRTIAVSDCNVNAQEPLPMESSPSPASRQIGASLARSAKTHLVPRLRKTLEVLRAIVITASIEAGVPVTEIRFDAFTDPEEGWTRLRCAVAVKCSAEQALAFWDFVGARIDRWTHGLPAEEASTVAEMFTVYVEWE